MLGKRPFNIEELQTIVTEFENIVNSRPLTAVIEGEITRPLRPIDFLLPQGSEFFPFHIFQADRTFIEYQAQINKKFDCVSIDWKLTEN